MTALIVVLSVAAYLTVGLFVGRLAYETANWEDDVFWAAVFTLAWPVAVPLWLVGQFVRWFFTHR